MTQLGAQFAQKCRVGENIAMTDAIDFPHSSLEYNT